MTELGARAGAPVMETKQVFNLPNNLTYGRLVAVPVVAALLLWGGNGARWMALLLFILAAITDFFDGYLARKWGQQSALWAGCSIPIADKVLVAVILLVLAADRTISGVHIWAAIIILSREVLVSGLREFLAELRVSVPVTRVAKWKTTVQLLAIGFLIAGPAGDKIMPYISDIGIAGLWVAAALTLYTGYDYFRAGIGHVMDGK